jgi:hypothetical protein
MKSCLNFPKYSKIKADFLNINDKFHVIFVYNYSLVNQNIQKNFRYLYWYVLKYFHLKNYKNYKSFNGIFHCLKMGTI